MPPMASGEPSVAPSLGPQPQGAGYRVQGELSADMTSLGPQSLASAPPDAPASEIEAGVATCSHEGGAPSHDLGSAPSHAAATYSHERGGHAHGGGSQGVDGAVEGEGERPAEGGANWLVDFDQMLRDMNPSGPVDLSVVDAGPAVPALPIEEWPPSGGPTDESRRSTRRSFLGFLGGGKSKTTKT